MTSTTLVRDLVLTTKSEEVRRIARNFVEEDLSSVFGEFVGPEAALAVFRELRGSTPYLLEDVAEACLTYAQTAVWDSDLDPQTSMFVFEYWASFSDNDFFNSITMFESHRPVCEAILRFLVARENLDPVAGGFPWLTPGSLDQDELVLLSGLSSESVRQARYQSGEHRLETGDDGRVAAEEARRWLQVKGSYLPPRIYPRKNYVPQQIFRTAAEFRRYIEAGLKQQAGTFQSMEPHVHAANQRCFERFASGEGLTSASCLNWLEPDVAVALGKRLNVSPKWLLRSALHIRTNLGEKEIQDVIEPGPALPEVGKTGFSVPDALPITGDSIREILGDCPWVQPHAKHTKPNTKMDGYVSRNGVAFTHQHEVSRKQYLWLPAELEPMLQGQNVDSYPKENIGLDGKYGRHSGLRKYPELCDASLIRVRIKTPQDLSNVLGVLAEAD